MNGWIENTAIFIHMSAAQYIRKEVIKIFLESERKASSGNSSKVNRVASKIQDSDIEADGRFTDPNLPGLYIDMEHPVDNKELGLHGQGYRIENKDGNRLGYYFLGTNNGKDMKELWLVDEYDNALEGTITLSTLEQAMKYVWLKNQEALDF